MKWKDKKGKALSFDELGDAEKEFSRDMAAPMTAIMDAIDPNSDRKKMISKKGDAEPVDVTATMPMEDWPAWAVPPQLKEKWMKLQKSPEQKAISETVSGSDLKKMKSQKGDDAAMKMEVYYQKGKSGPVIEVDDEEDMPSYIKGKKK